MSSLFILVAVGAVVAAGTFVLREYLAQPQAFKAYQPEQ
ncbi:hypothetical protein LMG26857_03805 [Achromobacter anxifer]|nr:hypothetical protein LMG26857_03805 [Achromobacter anxifer]